MPRPGQKAGDPAVRDGPALLWPGITAGFDARCECTWALLGGTYQVKARNVMCVTHGGPLDAALARMARWGVRGGD